MASEIVYGEKWQGREIMLKDAERTVADTNADNQFADCYLAKGTLSPLPLVRPSWDVVPRVLSKGVYRPGRNPDPDVVAELVSRSTEFRSRRWSVSQQRVMPLPKDWWVLAYRAYPQLPATPEYSHGWADVMMAGARWINETESDWKFSDAKEKHCRLATSTRGLTTLGAEQIVEAAESISGHICCVCGRYGKSGPPNGLVLCLTHTLDGSWRETGNV
jgi:hypothetical protein